MKAESTKLPNLSLLRRSIMLDARGVMTYVLRTIMLCFCLYYLYDLVESMNYLSGPIGLRLFEYLTGLNTVIITFAGISYFATVISEEAEENTLGLLLMTGISPFAMIISKLGSRLLFAVFLFLAQIPFTFLAVTLGGITLSQILAVYICLMAYTVFLAALGLFVSVLSASTYTAYALMMLGLSIFYFVHYVLHFFISGICYLFNLEEKMLYQFYAYWHQLSPFNQFDQILVVRQYQFINFQVVGNLVLSGIFFSLAWVVFKFFRQKNIDSGVEKYVQRYNFHESKRMRLAGRVWRNCIFWKEFNFSNGGVIGLLLRCFLYIGLGFHVYWESSFGNHSLIAYGTQWGLIMLLLELSMIFSGVVKNEIRHNTLSSLAMLPEDIGKTINLKILSALPFCLPCVIYLIVFFVFGLYQFGRPDWEFLWVICSVVSLMTMFSATLLFYSLYIKHGAFIFSGLTSFAILFCFGYFIEVLFRPANMKYFFFTINCSFLSIAFGFYWLFRTHLPKFCSKS